MARIPRILITGDPTVYHVISRTAPQGFPLEDIENDFLVELIKNASRPGTAIKKGDWYKEFKKSVRPDHNWSRFTDFSIYSAILSAINKHRGQICQITAPYPKKPKHTNTGRSLTTTFLQARHPQHP